MSTEAEQPSEETAPVDNTSPGVQGANSNNSTYASETDSVFSFTKLTKCLKDSQQVPKFLEDMPLPSPTTGDRPEQTPSADVNNGKSDIGLDSYLEAYSEILALLKSLGKAFYFVVTDVHDKMTILRRHRLGPHGPHYMTVRRMVNYEMKNNLLQPVTKSAPANGSRTLLRLHRALLFVVRLLEMLLDTSKSDQKFGSLVYEAYKETLSEHHVWLVRKAVGAAVYLLPTREQFVDEIAKSQVDINQPIGMGVVGGCSAAEVVKLSALAVSQLNKVYRRINKVYTEYDLHGLA